MPFIATKDGSDIKFTMIQSYSIQNDKKKSYSIQYYALQYPRNPRIYTPISALPMLEFMISKIIRKKSSIGKVLKTLLTLDVVMTRVSWPANHFPNHMAQMVNLKLHNSWSEFVICYTYFTFLGYAGLAHYGLSQTSSLPLDELCFYFLQNEKRQGKKKIGRMRMETIGAGCCMREECFDRVRIKGDGQRNLGA